MSAAERSYGRAALESRTTQGTGGVHEDILNGHALLVCSSRKSSWLRASLDYVVSQGLPQRPAQNVAHVAVRAENWNLRNEVPELFCRPAPQLGDSYHQQGLTHVYSYADGGCRQPVSRQPTANNLCNWGEEAPREKEKRGSKDLASYSGSAASCKKAVNMSFGITTQISNC